MIMFILKNHSRTFHHEDEYFNMRKLVHIQIAAEQCIRFHWLPQQSAETLKLSTLIVILIESKGWVNRQVIKLIDWIIF